MFNKTYFWFLFMLMFSKNYFWSHVSVTVDSNCSNCSNCLLSSRLVENLDEQRRLSTVSLQPPHVDADTTPPHFLRRHQSHSKYCPINTLSYDRTQCSDTIGCHPLTCGSSYHITPNVCLLLPSPITMIFFQSHHCPIRLYE